MINMNCAISIIFILLSHCALTLAWEADLCSDEDFNGFCGKLSNAGCLNVNEMLWCNDTDLEYTCNYDTTDQISSINTKGECLRLYDDDNCSGKSLALDPKTSGIGLYFRLDRFNDLTSSIGPCFDYECSSKELMFGSSSQCSLKDTIIIGTIPNLPFAPLPEGNGPITRIQRGYNKRVELVIAEIRLHHLQIIEDNKIIQEGTGSATNDEMCNYAHKQGQMSDSAGHIITQRLGGTGRHTGNIFPQSKNFNQRVWSIVEDLVVSVVQHSGRALFTVNLIYNNETDSRPHVIVYRLESGQPYHLIEQNNLPNPSNGATA